MPNRPQQDIAERKQLQRRRAYDARSAQENKDELSRQAVGRLKDLREYRSAKTVMWYIDCRSELRTRWVLPAELASDKTTVVPYSTVDTDGRNQLGLWRLEAMDEVVRGKWGILEPPPERWDEPSKIVSPKDLDLVIVPGVAFCRYGHRLGNGQGYYDRLLSAVREDCRLVALCFECQLFDDLTTEFHDVAMDFVVTEANVHSCK